MAANELRKRGFTEEAIEMLNAVRIDIAAVVRTIIEEGGEECEK